MHRYDVFHLDGLRTCQAEFLPQVVGMVPEYGTPGDAKGSVQSLECCADGFSREAVSQPEGLGVGLKGDEFDVSRFQLGGFNAPSVLKIDDE